MTHAALRPGATAVVTGGAAGIGLAAAGRFAGLGLRVCLADRDTAALQRAGAGLRATGAEVMEAVVDVGRLDEIERLERDVVAQWGGVDVLMNNAGVQPGSAVFGPGDAWATVIGVNLWGIIHGSRVFGPGMVARGQADGQARLIVNTGSKQGITTPPGDPAYNVAKAGVKAFTESLQHELRSTRGCGVSAHLLIPGFVFTGLTANGRTEKPDAAWTPDQVADFMLAGLDAGDFYILCPDNDVDRRTDERRILWAAGDIVENRTPLSRWDPAYAGAFKAFLADGAP